MARPQRVSEAEIFEAARATFVTRGAQAPLSEVARKLGVSAAALLHRTGSKEALLTRALDAPMGDVMSVFDLEASPSSLERLLLTLGAFLARQLPNIMVLHGAGHFVKPRGQPPTVLLRRALTKWLAPLRLRVNDEVAAEALLGALEARVFNRHLGNAQFSPGADRAFVKKLVDGFVEGTR
jgi:AcrR family transcriptional regulator